MTRISAQALERLRADWKRVTNEDLALEVRHEDGMEYPWVFVYTSELNALRLFHYYRNSYLRDRTSIEVQEGFDTWMFSMELGIFFR